jgi:hypothetical protein
MLFEILLRDIRECLKKNERSGYKKINVNIFGPEEHLFDSMDFGQANKGLARGLGELHKIEVPI